MRKYIAIIIASLALFTGQAHAQRCLPKMQGIEVRADMADGFNLGGKDGGYSFGAALSTYTKKVPARLSHRRDLLRGARSRRLR